MEKNGEKPNMPSRKIEHRIDRDQKESGKIYQYQKSTKK